MAYYKTASLLIPINCKYECIHCAHKNTGRGRLSVTGDTVRYAPGIFNRAEHEQSATMRSLEGVSPRIAPACKALISTVNIHKQHHPALASIRPVCAKCGKRQPWQTRNWSAYLLYAMGGAIVFFIGLIVVKPELWETNSETIALLAVSIALLLFMLSLIAPSIQGMWVNRKMKPHRDTPCFPMIYFDSPPPSSSGRSDS